MPESGESSPTQKQRSLAKPSDAGASVYRFSAGAAPPPGTYAFSGKLSPSGFGVIGPRIGYAGDHWLPHLRLGTIITGGSHNSTLNYTSTGTLKPTASACAAFSGVSLDSTHNSFTANMFRIGINYWFWY